MKAKHFLLLSLCSILPASALTWTDASSDNNWNTTVTIWDASTTNWVNGSAADFSGAGSSGLNDLREIFLSRAAAQFCKSVLERSMVKTFLILQV
jgi:hypothetical protein